MDDIAREHASLVQEGRGGTTKKKIITQRMSYLITDLMSIVTTDSLTVDAGQGYRE